MAFLMRWFWYHRLTWIDVRRMWMLFMIHVCIVAGICLPILILAGLKRGHVTQLREQLVTSPTGRQVIFFSATRGEIMTDEAVERLQQSLPDVDLIIPELEIVAQLRRTDGAAGAGLDVTLRSSRQGDPILAQHGADAIRPGERGLVLSRQLGDELAVQVGDGVTLILFRKGKEQAEVACEVAAVTAAGALEGNVGFADVAVLNRCQQYIKGFGVGDWNLPTSPGLEAADKYPGYLIFCKKTDDFRDRDREFFLEKGYRLEAVEDVERRKLFGLLNEKSLEQLKVYHLTTADSVTDPRARLSLTPTEIGKWASSVDDVIIPWNEPREVTVDGKPWRLIGCTFPDPTWLRRYLIDPTLPFDYETKEFFLRVSRSGPKIATPVVTLPLRGEDQVELAVEAAAVPTAEEAKLDVIAKPEPVTEPAFAPYLAEVARWSAAVQPALQPLLDRAEKVRAELSSAFEPYQPLVSRLREYVAQAIEEARTAPPPTDPAVVPAPAETAPTGPLLAVVPIQLLAHLEAYDHGTALYDRQRKCFVPPADSPRYNQARLYAKTIDHVTPAVQELTKLGFGQISEKTRIEEIHKQDESLALLVRIVTWVVGAFGIVTVWIVLMESTNRKRRDIGILRIMGASGYAVLYMVMLRAALIGIGAAIMAAGIGWAACELLTWEPGAAWLADGDSFTATAWNQLLTWKPVTSAHLDLREDWRIVSVAMLCSLLGSIAPAVMASRLDPFDALVHAKDS